MKPSSFLRRLIGPAILLALICVGFFGIRITRVGTFRHMLEQNVAIGASPSDVIRFLDSRHLEHTVLFRPTAMGMGGRNYDNQLVIVFTKSYSWVSSFAMESIRVVFVFDEHQKLTRFDSFPVYRIL